MHGRRVLLLALFGSLSWSCLQASRGLRPAWEAYNEGNGAYYAGDFATCKARFVEYASYASARAIGMLSAACCESKAGRFDSALGYAEAAVNAGYRDADWFMEDEDLVSLHESPRWPVLFARVQANQAAYDATVNIELRRLKDADQADRREPINWAEVTPRDLERQKQVAAIMARGEARVAEDFFNAAVIMQHSDGTGGIELANQYARRAVELEPDSPLVSAFYGATIDRLLVRHGKLQRYGTQLEKQDGIWVMLPVDRSVGDAERLALYLPTLAEAKARLARMNQPASEARDKGAADEGAAAAP